MVYTLQILVVIVLFWYPRSVEGPEQNSTGTLVEKNNYPKKELNPLPELPGTILLLNEPGTGFKAFSFFGLDK